MRDQSHGRINGCAAAAFATICERKLNIASVLKSAGDFAGEFVSGSGMRRSLRIRQESGTNNFRDGVSFPGPIRGAGMAKSLKILVDSTPARPRGDKLPVRRVEQQLKPTLKTNEGYDAVLQRAVRATDVFDRGYKRGDGRCCIRQFVVDRHARQWRRRIVRLKAAETVRNYIRGGVGRNVSP